MNSITNRHRNFPRLPVLFARMDTSFIEETEAIGCYEQRISLEKYKAAKAIMEMRSRKG